MQAAQRRQEIRRRLEQLEEPISASALAAEFGVSRQIIVGDIALLRAAGLPVSATPRGYLLPRERTGLLYTVACIHPPEGIGPEMFACVDNGCAVLDVVVEHPLYGQLTGQLQAFSRYDVEQFLRKVEEADAHPLSLLTDGVHLHTLRCPDEAAYERVRQALDQLGYLWKGQK